MDIGQIVEKRFFTSKIGLHFDDEAARREESAVGKTGTVHPKQHIRVGEQLQLEVYGG